ncbi:restriction endonuclease subunit S [Halocella sp. SP3-1]|uniref:restriction endonuclease subunit S n=1 Tax=Halocella sp. SP3-1 TaxID=2382161 RepID=UPI00197ABFC3|nr:restriction endonuclease subunit S [Halocella sp. SP3-1]
MFTLIYRYPTYYGIKYEDTGVIEVRGEMLKKGYIDLSKEPRYISKKTSSRFPKTILSKGDIVMSVRGTMGKIGLVKEELEGANITANLLKLSPKRQLINSKWLSIILNSNLFEGILNNVSTQTTIKTITVPELGSIQMPVPPIKEQKAIAIFFDKETGRIDQLIDKKEQLIELLQEKRQALISQAVTKGLNSDVPMKDSGIEFLGEIPEQWEITQLKRIQAKEEYSFVDGPFGSDLKNEEYTDDGIPLIQLNNIKIGEHVIQNTNYISEEKARELYKHNIFPGDIVIAKMADPVARAAIVKSVYGKYVIVADCVKLSPNIKKINRDFLVYSINSKFIRQEAEKVSSGTTRLRISLGELKNLKILLPPIEEQQQIADYLDKETSKIDTLVEKVTQQISNLKEYRQALISNAVTGKIDVREVYQDE